MTFCVVIESLAGMVSNYGWCCYRPILGPVMIPAGVVIKLADILDVRILNRVGKVSDWIASISRLDVIQKQTKTTLSHVLFLLVQILWSEEKFMRML